MSSELPSPWRVDGAAAPLLHPWYLFILPSNIALIVGVALMDWPSRTTVGA
jgi:hypothetical protein